MFSDPPILVALIMDEMHLMENLYYNIHSDCIEGVVDSGFRYDSTTKALTSTRQGSFANHAQMYMIRVLGHGHRCPVQYHFNRGTSSVEGTRMELQQITTDLEKCNMEVVAIVCDQHSSNIKTLVKWIPMQKELREQRGLPESKIIE